MLQICEFKHQLCCYSPANLSGNGFITDASDAAHQHSLCRSMFCPFVQGFTRSTKGNKTRIGMQYLPFGEDLISQRIDWQTRYTFSAKEKDKNTGYHYFGARYYDSDVSVWLSVDPYARFYHDLSPYAYCANNPILYVDPDGKDVWCFFIEQGVKAGVGANGAYFRQFGHAKDNHSVTFYEIRAGQLTTGEGGDIVIGGDADAAEGGIASDTKSASFRTSVGLLDFTTISAGPFDLGFGDDFYLISGGASAGAAIGRVKVNEVTSYSFTKEEKQYLNDIAGYDVNVDNIKVRNEREIKNKNGKVIGLEGDLYIENYKGNKPIKTKIKMVRNGKDEKLWESIKYRNKTKGKE